MKTILAITFAALAGFPLILTSCGDRETKVEEKKYKGFRLPEGDAEKGELAFTQLKCHRCHSVEGVEFPKLEGEPGTLLSLGGKVTKMKTYGELVTAIIKPQHSVSPDYLSALEEDAREGADSPMSSLNETMTVQQMTDLVTFLHAHYTKFVPAYDTNPYYP